MVSHYHVTSVLNRESIAEHGLDWRRMDFAVGIAGSRSPEQNGLFLCQYEEDVEYFVRMNNTGGPVDVWSVEGVDNLELFDNGNGYFYFPGVISPERLTLVYADIDQLPDAAHFTAIPLLPWRHTQ